MSNLRLPPLFLRPSVVRALVSNLDSMATGLRQVPVAPIKLVDRPRRSEDPRLAKANDDSMDSGWVAPPVASEPEDWPDAPLPDHSDPDLDRPEPVEEGPAVAAALKARVRKSRATGAKAAAEAARAERNRSMVDAYVKGSTVEALAAQHGISTWLVYTVIRSAGVSRAPGYAASPEIAERNAQVAKAYAEGEDVDVLAARFGITRVNVYRIAKLAGTATRSKRSLEERNRMIAEAYADGEDVDAIAARFGVTRSSISVIGRKAGVKRQRVPQHAERNAEVCAAYAAGEALATIAERFDLKAGSIVQIASKAGVRRPKTAPAPRPPKVAKPKVDRAPKPKKLRIAATRPFNVDRAGDATQAPEGTSAGVGGAVIHRANACEQSTKSSKAADFYGEAAIKRRLQDAGRARTLEETRHAKAQRIARRAERAAEADAAAAEFAAALERVRARREAGVEIIVPKPALPINSGAKLAEAIRRRDAAKASSARPAARPIEPAPSREECPRCGVPGWKGCAHFLPCQDGPPPTPDTDELRKIPKFTGSRQGISVLRIR